MCSPSTRLRWKHGLGPSRGTGDFHRIADLSLLRARLGRRRRFIPQCRRGRRLEAKRDPIARCAQRLSEQRLLDDGDLEELDKEAKETVEAAVRFAEESPWPAPL